jgi:formylglycine-generating enzyme required for sulfatase activity/serine/threonine protein kinase
MESSVMMPETTDAVNVAQPQVFVSYARQDAERVLSIARLLEQEGTTVWRDQEQILGGQYYGEQIVHAIAHSRVVMLMCSPLAFQSDNVHREVLLTWDHYHRRYIPVWLCPASEIPERFRYCLAVCQWIDAHSQPPEKWLPQLLKALTSLGVETKNPASRPVVPASGPAEASDRRGFRFRPGDKPIKGADWGLERLLGKGGFGEVWKARNTHLESVPPVALKFCLELDDRANGLLKHEADMVLRAQQQIRSNGIVPLLHAYLSNDPPCLEYPYIEGGTMVQLLDGYRDSAGSFTPVQVERIVHRIAQIVGPAHRATPKLVHRDLKPSNVLVQHRGEGKLVLRVTDFGIGGLAARPALERSRSSSSMKDNMSSVLMGSYSPLYASPQQIRGDRPDPRDDVYALGVIWYQFLMGDLASPAPTGRKWIDVLRGRGMSDPAVQLLSSCFESDPADRPTDAGMLAEQLKALPDATMTKPAGSKPDLSVGKPWPHTPLEPSPPRLRDGTPNTPCEQTVRSASTQCPAPEMTNSQHVSPVPSAQHAEAFANSDRFGTTGAFKRRVVAGSLGLAGLLGVILYIATDNGTVKITGTDPVMRVLVDGEEIRIENLGKPITIRTGRHKLAVTRDNLEVQADTFILRRGEEKVLDVSYTPRAREANNSQAAESPDPYYLTTRVAQIKLKRLPAGMFQMGSPDNDTAAETDEKPQHRVRITSPFYLGVYEVTQGQYETVIGSNPSTFSASGGGRACVVGQSTDRYPVENVSWLDAVKFCNELGKMEGVPAFYEINGEKVRVLNWNRAGYRLPTEAEWEYACRANAATPTRFSFGDDEPNLDGFAWYDGDGSRKTHPVGEKPPNGLGLFDMHGNVWEWCWDGYGRSYYKEAGERDPRGLDQASSRVVRGGGRQSGPRDCRSASRDWCASIDRNHYLGFRVALVQSGH